MLLPLAFALPAAAAAAAPAQASDRSSMLQAWSADLENNSGDAKDSPVARVVGLLQKMSKQLSSEAQEDEDLYKKLACWCKSNEREKSEALKESNAKIAELESNRDALAAKKTELTQTIKELEDELATDKKALAEGQALRDKQIAEAQKEANELIQNIETLRAAIVVLSKHHGGLPEEPGAKKPAQAKAAPADSDDGDSDAPSFLQQDPAATDDHQLDDFMRHNGFNDVHEDAAAPSDMDMPSGKQVMQKFLQQQDTAAAELTTWTMMDTALVHKAMNTAAAYAKVHHSDSQPYSQESGQIMGILKQMHDEMSADLSANQKQEQERAEDFAEVRKAKTTEVESSEKMIESKEDELAQTTNDHAQARVDLSRVEELLSEDQKFMRNLEQTCTDADKNFEARKAARLKEIQAVSETIKILEDDEAKEAMLGTFNFLQVSSSEKSSNEKLRRIDAAKALRQASRQLKAPQLSILATTVELDAFSKVKKAIDDMVAMLKQQQADEVKKTDYCKSGIHSNEMATEKATTQKTDLEAKVDDLESTVKSLTDGIADDRQEITGLETELQLASQERKKANQEFQNTIADQITTIAVLTKALDKLATFYNAQFLQTKANPAFIQKHKAGRKQTPPVAQMEYTPSSGSSGVMQMIEKLMGDAKVLMADAKAGEMTAQASYEKLIEDTNGSIAALRKSINSQTRGKVRSTKDLGLAQSDLADTTQELDGLAKFNSDLHADCDYLLRNFDLRQKARNEELEALRHAKSILSGATAR